MMNSESQVLLVDDEPNVIQGIIRHLRSEPYRILSATSAAEALRMLATEKIDVLITDERMPKMSGSELVAQVRKAYPDIICMMLSGQADFDAAIRAINDGEIYRFLRKPCDPLEIATDIRLALEHQSLIVQSRKLQDQYRKELSFTQKLKQNHPDLFEIQYDKDGFVVIDESEYNLEQNILLENKNK